MDIKDILELSDGKKYIITSKAEYKGYEYLYIAEISMEDNIKFCRVVKNGDVVNLQVITDDKLITELLPLFATNLDKFINE
jgi:hypothetical protein